jgi:transcriptional regulator with XRE-family HTH domain
MSSKVKIRKTIDYEIPSLGQKIKEARKQSPKSITDLASEAGMSVGNWYRIESEKVDFLPESTLIAIQAVLNIDFGVALND